MFTAAHTAADDGVIDASGASLDFAESASELAPYWHAAAQPADPIPHNEVVV